MRTKEAMYHKTSLMARVEEKLGRPLHEVIPESINEVGVAKTAVDVLDVTESTLYGWLVRLGIRIERVALRVDESYMIVSDEYDA